MNPTQRWAVLERSHNQVMVSVLMLPQLAHYFLETRRRLRREKTASRWAVNVTPGCTVCLCLEMARVDITPVQNTYILIVHVNVSKI